MTRYPASALADLSPQRASARTAERKPPPTARDSR